MSNQALTISLAKGMGKLGDNYIAVRDIQTHPQPLF